MKLAFSLLAVVIILGFGVALLTASIRQPTNKTAPVTIRREKDHKPHSLKQKIGLSLVGMALLPIGGMIGSVAVVGTYTLINGSTTIHLANHTFRTNLLSEGGVEVSLTEPGDNGIFRRNWILDQPNYPPIQYSEQHP